MRDNSFEPSVFECCFERPAEGFDRLPATMKNIRAFWRPLRQSPFDDFPEFTD